MVKTPRARGMVALVLALAALASAPQAARAQAAGGHTVLAVTAANQLVRFSSAAPGASSAPTPITGLQAGESILGIDVRPATGELFALGSSSRLYVLNPATGAATQVGTGAFALPLAGAEFGFDFNPTVDRIRVVSDAGQNLRINPTNGAVVDADPAAAGVQPDGALNGAATGLVGAGYTNSLPGVTATTLYGIDAAGDQLVIQNPPNNGVTVAVGPLGVDVRGAAGFDIAPGGNQAFAALTLGGESTSRWYTINLASGAATAIGPLGVAVRALAVVPPPPDTLYGLTAANRLIAFSSAAPGAITATRDITGLASGETLLGIDFRPADGRLYALGSTSRIYVIDTWTGAATPVGAQPLSPPLAGATFGLDFNPAVDRIRIVSDAGQNLRVNPATGAALVDGPLAYAAGDANAGASPGVAAAGYTNNISGTTSTQLFVIDAGLDILALQNPPNNGTLTTVGALGVDVSDQLGFDITRGGVAYVAFAAPGGTSSSLGVLNVSTGALVSLGAIGGGAVVRDLAAPTWRAPLYLPLVSR